MARMTRMTCVVRIAVLSAVLVGVAPSAARAQQQGDPKLSELLFNLYVPAIVTNVTAFEIVFPGSIDRLLGTGDPLLGPAFATPESVNELMGIQVSSFPLGSSAGGFSWTFDPALGTFNRVSSSFGPVFSERALTIGRRRLNVGANYQRATFDKLEGQNLRDGSIRIYTGVAFGSSYIVLEDSLDLKVSTDTVGVFATYGITDRIDVGIAVPIMNVDMRARLDTRIGSSVDAGIDPEIIATNSVSGNASGIGDVVLRGKYNFLRARGGGLAAGVDWRLPTGDEEELLGIAGAQGKFYLAASSAYGRISPHANFGYTISGDTAAARSEETFVLDPPNEFGYAAGVDFAATPRLTLVGDIVGRAIRDTVRLDFGQIRLPDLASAAGELATDFSGSRSRRGNLNQVLGSVGAKFNPMGNALFAFNVLFPLNDVGLRDNMTWVAGFEWSF
jgi:hypothetical protein